MKPYCKVEMMSGSPLWRVEFGYGGPVEVEPETSRRYGEIADVGVAIRHWLKNGTVVEPPSA